MGIGSPGFPMRSAAMSSLLSWKSRGSDPAFLIHSAGNEHFLAKTCWLFSKPSASYRERWASQYACRSMGVQGAMIPRSRVPATGTLFSIRRNNIPMDKTDLTAHLGLQTQSCFQRTKQAHSPCSRVPATGTLFPLAASSRNTFPKDK